MMRSVASTERPPASKQVKQRHGCARLVYTPSKVALGDNLDRIK